MKVKGFSIYMQDGKGKVTICNTEKSDHVTITADDSVNRIKVNMTENQFVELADMLLNEAEKIARKNASETVIGLETPEDLTPIEDTETR